MITTLRTDSSHPDFISLVGLLDADLAVRDGADHSFYAQFNKLDKIRHVVLAYHGATPVGCGAIKDAGGDAAEIKRMYVLPQTRRKGVAALVLSDLEQWATELAYIRCILETGRKQPEAIALYKKCGYKRIENYGQYAGIENSLCFQKILSSKNDTIHQVDAHDTPS